MQNNVTFKNIMNNEGRVINRLITISFLDRVEMV